MPIRTLHQDDSLRLCASERLFISVFRDVPRIEQVRTLGRVVSEHLTQLAGQKQVYINIVTDGIPKFTDEVRQELTAVAQRFSAEREAVAHAILTSGLAGTTVRTFTSTMLLLARPKAPTKVFSTLDEAVAWLLPHLGPGWNHARLLSACTTAMARV